MTPSLVFKRLLPALLGAFLMCSAQAGVMPTIDLGLAAGYSGFFYGNASKVVDVEGKLAVGGNLATSAFSFGYRTPYGVGGPSLVVGGNVALGDGSIFSGPSTNVDTNATIGPDTSWQKPEGYGVYGGKNSSVSYLQLNKQANVVDFAAAKTQLSKLSSDLAAQSANGKVESKWGGLYLTGDNSSDVQIFTINSNQLSNLTLQNVKQSATVVINVTGGGSVVFGGGQDGQLQAMRDRILFNVIEASSVAVNTFTWGTVLANKADIIGSGHLEGNLIANSISSNVEIGYEAFRGYTPPPSYAARNPVPEPATGMVLVTGLALISLLRRRRRNGMAGTV
ncbi:MAG: choice-of-anchor A family protein [Pseudomonadota bacterium]